MNRRWLAPSLWLLVTLAGLWFVTTRLAVHSELGDLLPEGSTTTQRLLLTQIRTGLSGRLILLALEGGTSDELSASSKALGEKLRANPRLGFVGNGAQAWSKAEQDLLFRYRYLLSRHVGPETFTQSSLRQALEQRLDDLRSPLAPIVKGLIPADPTGETLGILQAWSGWEAPTKYRGVWMSADRAKALVVVETRAAGFDADAQEAIQREIRQAFSEVQGEARTTKLVMSGPGVFAVEIQRTIEAEAWWLSMVAGTLVLLFLMFAYRSVLLVALSLIPLSSAILAGMIAVQSWFGFVHGITLGFGITLLGVVDDYPIHLFSHVTARDTAPVVMRAIWPTMRLGVLLTAIGFSALLLAGFPALAQLGLFSFVGLLAGALVTRWVLPNCVPNGFVPREIRSSLVAGVETLPKGRWFVPVVAVLATVTLIWSDTPLWQEDLGSLSPLAEEKKQLDQKLRQELGAPDVRDLLVIGGASEEEVLQRAERMQSRLDQLREEQALTGFDIVTRYVPSRRLQQERRQALPERASLERNLTAAQQGLPFAAGVFAPFLDAVETARREPLVDRQTFAGTMLGMKLESLLVAQADQWIAVVPLRGVADRDQLAGTAAGWGEPEVAYVDLKKESNRLMAAYRYRTLQLLGWGILAIAAILAVSLRSVKALWPVLAPVLCSLLVVTAILKVSGESLSLFHVATFLLVIGLGLDYALFFNRPDEVGDDRARTRCGLLVCSTTTILVFGVLAFSTIPVLHAIGVTAAIGSFCCLLFAGFLAKQEVTSA